MRVYVAGKGAFAAEVFSLASRLGHEVVGVSAPPLRGGGQLPDRLRAAAEREGVPWLPAGQLRADLLPDGTDLIIAAHSHDFIGRATLARSRLGGVGYHPSLLPRHRGRDAIRWTIHMGDPVAGGSVYWLSNRVDGGDIAAQDFAFVSPDETPDSLWRGKLFPMGLKLFEQVLEDLKAGVIRRQPQDEAHATWEPSWSRAPLHRPELLLLGSAPEGFTYSQRAARSG
jgi:methionyl-tRNA formyltransferase